MVRDLKRKSLRGISLLEVLISIGILSIGLISTLALIPAGRTYLKKAAVDDRAAALVPNAYATTRTLGLLTVNALSWRDIPPDAPFTDPNEPALPPVIRNINGHNAFDSSSTGSSEDADWTIETIDTETIQTRHPQDGAPILRGTVPPVPVTDPPAAEGYEVNVATAPASSLGANVRANPITGQWSAGPFPVGHPSAPVMTIHESGSNVGQPNNQAYIDYTITATYTGTAGPANANPSPASFRQYGRRRATDLRTGKAKTTYTRPENADDSNAAPASALPVPMPLLENATSQGRNSIARSVHRQVLGTLWRMELGTRRGTYEQFVDFENMNAAPPRPRNPVYIQRDITENVGYTWLDGDTEVAPTPPAIPETIEDVDWYRIDVSAGDVLQLDFSDPADVLSMALGNRKFPVYLNTTNPSLESLLAPIASLSAEGRDVYSIPNDGYVITRAALRPLPDPNSAASRAAAIPTLLNTFGPAGSNYSSRRNPAYDFTVRLSRSERVVVIDPLMATRLDKVIALKGGVGRLDPYYLRRHRFADFQQTFGTTNQQRAFIIPRLNFQKYSAGDLDTMLAMAERMFRDQDNIAIRTPANDDDAPTQIFDLTTGGSPVRRQAEGRMSWLLMLQPEDPGPVAANWIAGRYFDVSMVVFEDRKLPALAADSALDGEYAFKALWSDIDGMITVEVPADLVKDSLDEDDIRDLFRTGAWLLLAPQTTYEASPLDSTQRLDWIRIQTSRMEKQGDGSVRVYVLPESEPAETILYRRGTNPNVSPIIALAYQGVVAVVKKSMKLEP